MARFLRKQFQKGRYKLPDELILRAPLKKYIAFFQIFLNKKVLFDEAKNLENATKKINVIETTSVQFFT